MIFTSESSNIHWKHALKYPYIKSSWLWKVNKWGKISMKEGGVISEWRLDKEYHGWSDITWCLKKDYVIFLLNIHELHYSMVFKIVVAAKVCYVLIAWIYMCWSIWCWTGPVRHVMTNPCLTRYYHKNLSTSLITMIFRYCHKMLYGKNQDEFSPRC